MIASLFTVILIWCEGGEVVSLSEFWVTDEGVVYDDWTHVYHSCWFSEFVMQFGCIACFGCVAEGHKKDFARGFICLFEVVVNFADS